MMYIKEINILETSIRDSLHMAIALINGMDYLATWNCKHIARGEIKKMIRLINEREGIVSPVICTPEELLGGI